MKTSYEKSISPFAPSGSFSGNPTTHRPNFPGARSIREARQMYVGDHQYVTINTTDDTWSVFAGTLLVVEGAKPDFKDNTEMYAAAFELATAYVATPELVTPRPSLPRRCRHCASFRVNRYTTTPPPVRGEVAKAQHGHICNRCRMYTPLI